MHAPVERSKLVSHKLKEILAGPFTYIDNFMGTAVQTTDLLNKLKKCREKKTHDQVEDPEIRQLLKFDYGDGTWLQTEMADSKGFQT